MVREEVLEKSRELVNQIYEKMNVIESCDTLAKKVKDLDVCFNDSDNKQVVSLYGILSESQISTVRENIVNIIYSNATEAQSFLERLNRKPATINPEFEAAVQDMVETGSKPKTGGRKTIELDINQVRDMYINQGMTYKAIATVLKCSDFTVRKFCNNNGIIRGQEAPVDKPLEPAEKPAYPVVTVEAVRDIYTNGSMSLADTAKYFGVASGELYTYIEKHGLKRKIVKSNDPFRDKNKMGKDEFMTKMLDSRK